MLGCDELKEWREQWEIYMHLQSVKLRRQSGEYLRTASSAQVERFQTVEGDRCIDVVAKPS